MFLSAESLLNRQPGATRSHIVRSAIVGGPPVTVDGGLPSVRSEKRQAAARQGATESSPTCSMRRTQTPLIEGKEGTACQSRVMGPRRGQRWDARPSRPLLPGTRSC